MEHGYTRGEVNATTFHLQVQLTPLASHIIASLSARLSERGEGAG